MSLSRAQREATKAELMANMTLSGQGADDIALGLGLTHAEVERTIRLDGADPATVWQVRD